MSDIEVSTEVVLTSCAVTGRIAEANPTELKSIPARIGINWIKSGKTHEPVNVGTVVI
jgi:hypothetical protein